MTRLAIVTVLSITTVFLASGCLWGFVRDTETGAGVAGATVSWTDSEGRSHSTVTNSSGLYVFDHASGPVPRSGYVNFALEKWYSCPRIEEQRLVQYDDNVNAVDLSDRWEIQNFSLWCYPPTATPTPHYPQPPTPDPRLVPLPVLLPTSTPTPVAR